MLTGQGRHSGAQYHRGYDQLERSGVIVGPTRGARDSRKRLERVEIDSNSDDCGLLTKGGSKTGAVTGGSGGLEHPSPTGTPIHVTSTSHLNGRGRTGPSVDHSPPGMQLLNYLLNIYCSFTVIFLVLDLDLIFYTNFFVY